MVVVLVLVAIVALAVAFRGPIARAAVSGAVDIATGSRISFDRLAIDGDTIDARGVHFERGSGLVVDATRALVRYHLHDAIFGGGTRYGLQSIAIEQPTITLIRRADGAFDIGQTSGVATPATQARSSVQPQTPLIATVTLAGGRVRFRDADRNLQLARELDLDRIAVRARIDTATTSSYAVRVRIPGDEAARLRVDGRIDASGYAIHHVRARAVGIVPFVNYFINSPAAQVISGTLTDGDVRAYSFGGSMHVVGSAGIRDTAMAVPGLDPIATGMNGRIDFYDNGIATTGLRARLGTLDAIATGGLYGFDRKTPIFRLGIAVARAPLGEARDLFSFARRLPLRGDGRIETLLEGDVPRPVIITRVTAPSAAYASFPIADLDGRVYVYNGVVCVGGTHARYDGLDVDAGGTIETGDVATSDLVVAVRGPAARVPYAAQIARGSTLHAVGRIAGAGLKLDAIGTLATDARGSANGATLAGLFHIDPQGDGAFGPLLATRPDGSSLAGTFYLDREHSASAFWLDARRYAFASLSPAPRFPGLALAPPEFDGTLDGSVAGSGPPSDFRIAGHVHAQGLRVGTLALGDVGGDVTGHIGNLRVGNVLARGAWGTLAGRGAYVGTRLAIAGTYRGSFDRLRAFTGELGARGPLSGPVSLLIDPKTTVVQARSVDTPGARVRGVPVDSLGGTVAVTATRVHIYAAHADIAGARFAAAGTLAIAKGGAEPRGLPGVGVSIADADARRLHAVAPVDGGGRIATIGTFRSDGAQTRYDGGVALAGAHVQRIPVAGNGDIGLRGTRLTFSQTTALAGGAVAALAGSLGGLDTKRPRYDATVALSETPLGPIARAFAPRRHDIAGTIAGHFAVRGSADDLEIRGRLAMPEGAFNGLSFRDASANITIAPGGVGARAGTITVGSTVTRFGGFFRGGDGGVRVDAPQADLSDFNDLFDTGDTLGGKGHIAVRFLQNRGVVRSNADIGIAALKFKTFDLGDAVAQWSSRGQNVTGTLGFGGRSGRLDIAGTLGLATHSPLDKLLERSRFNGNAQLRGLDLGVWLPALGYQLPITGRVDADTRIAGLLRKPDVRTSAKLVNGTIGKLPVNSFTVVASSTLSRTTIQSLELNVPSLSLTGSGSFGLGPKDSVALRLHAKSGNVGALSGELLGAAFPVTGTAEADVGVDGTRASPRVAGGFDVESAAFRGIAVPQALGEFSIRGRDLVLSDVEVGFATGTLYVAGSLPLQLAPFAFGPAQAPIELDLTAKNIDMADFAPLFPAGSTLKGMLGGRVAIAGTAGKPELDGSIALTNGAASTPLETVPITNLRGTLAFERTSVALRELHAEAGGGSLDASGSVTLADLVDLGADANYRFDAKARALRLSLPAYGSGQIDGTLSLRHARGSARTLAGALNLNDATIPFAALLLAAGPGTGDQIDATPVVTATAKPGNLALDLDVAAERNVRVRSANVDIGGRGTLHVGGTFGAPKLDGGFDSTGGTLTYFNTVFRVIDGRVSFRPDQGVIPTLTAHAETHVINPDPNSVRNTSGSADVTLDIHGPVTGLTIGLTSDPAYDRQQVLGLLLNAPALGATDLFDTPGQATLYGSTSTSAQSRDVSVARTTSFGQTTVAQEAFGVANAQFTRTLLAPAETTFANAVGLTNFNVNVDLTGNVGFQARKVLGKEVSAVYGTTIGYPYRQTFGFELKPNVVTAAQVTVFQTYGNAGLSSLNPGSLTPGFGTARLTSAQPSTGTVGFSVSLQRLFP